MTELSQLLRQLCSLEILEKRPGVDSPTNYYFVTLPCGAGVSYTNARLCVEHPDAPLVDMLVRGVASELKEFMVEHKILISEADFEQWVGVVVNIGWHLERTRELVGSLTCAEAWKSDDSLEELLAPSLTNRQHTEYIKKFLGVVLHPKNGEWPRPLPDPETLPDPEIMQSLSSNTTRGKTPTNLAKGYS